jgi:subtilisin family serine protease
VDAGALGRVWQLRDPERPLSAVVELPAGAGTPPGLTRVGPGLAVFHGTAQSVAELAAAHPGWRLGWAPPRRPLLNAAGDTTRAGQFRNLTGLTGKGAVIGIVDTGFDPNHPDLRDAAGKSRVAWAIDFSREPLGRHPDLEADAGCSGAGYSCAVYSGADLDELAAAGSVHLPRDTIGHGTHVASLAAGNGLSSEPPRYVGIAPEATIVAARVTRGGDGSILDPDVLLATRFVFERAKELGLPAVVNLSLGSDFGGHDGQSALERGLSTFVGSGEPGRAIVVAAGNSGGVFGQIFPGYPQPFGVHTEVHVPRESSVRVPILTPSVGKSSTSATIYVWVSGRPGDRLEVGVDDADGEWIEPLPPGEGAAYSGKGVEVTILNQVVGGGSPIATGSNGAVVVIEGTWPAGAAFAVRLEGHGSARLWLQSDGDLTPGAGSPGALFPGASKEGTIGIPATSEALISVGATVNRVLWEDRKQQKVLLEKLGPQSPPKVDSSAYFSGSGPTATGLMKPDVVAPGAFVIGAMSKLADPESNGGSGMFAGGGVCGDRPGCLVIDDFHALSSGTSMAAPIVSGAVALLFQRDPSLDQAGLRTLLQAGARALDGAVLLEQQVGPGELDLVGTLSVMNAGTTPLQTTPDPEESWLALASSYAHPDPDWPLEAVLELRAGDESVVDGFDPRNLELFVSGGRVVQPLTRVAPGLWRLSAAADAGSGGSTLTLSLRYAGQPFLTRSVPVAVDRAVAAGGVDARGGCAAGRGRGQGALGFLLALSILLGARRIRSRSR